MPGHAGRGQTLFAELAEVVAEFADGRLQVVLQTAGGDPLAEAVEVPAVGQDRVDGHAALGLDVVTEGAKVVEELGVGRHDGAPFHPGRKETLLLSTDLAATHACFFLFFRPSRARSESSSGVSGPAGTPLTPLEDSL